MKARWALKQGDYAATGARRAAFRRLLVAHGRTSKLVPSELVFGELITNAIRYGEDPMAVEVAADNGKLRICVDNSGECFDLSLAMLKEPTTEGGRGLRIVAALADHMTIESTAHHACRITVDMSI